MFTIVLNAMYWAHHCCRDLIHPHHGCCLAGYTCRVNCQNRYNRCSNSDLHHHLPNRSFPDGPWYLSDNSEAKQFEKPVTVSTLVGDETDGSSGPLRPMFGAFVHIRTYLSAGSLHRY